MEETHQTPTLFQLTAQLSEVNKPEAARSVSHPCTPCLHPKCNAKDAELLSAGTNLEISSSHIGLIEM